MDIQGLLQKLVSIPSYVSHEVNEVQLAQFIESELLSINGVNVERQYVDQNRYNITVSTPGTSKVLLAAHMDTVPPSLGWTKKMMEVI